ncbi:DUF1223 domain-containing protein [Paraburkholderia domus]|uniref:DUF1223 domain-containing protein n=1 Tax=Paraburkholderia domus TaxID=2793075 RepID=UPI001914A2C0|nr:DUF1223 domain-containing protein [Paraburkholderia domus]MBK5052316.1 DUF1223 domain-containing protein [Burkholderia sp. R-70006]MBK5182151.1 DUF1223 domain-containing protein [Burkholderia sp. R-69749]MCI0151291.1 DUF1223 domain-containing protein [Paraburkholderia sediminicola]CAE6806752.1 hypothetical protein R70006_05564 [Paraburkholderia domus]CAE6841905.1 hypothetical protein R69749_04495 [Paraburkholderia domus]
MLSRLLASLSLLVALPVAAAMPRPVVVELFTSEGCSSCPPADAYLSELSQQRSDILPLAFHVTYWNSIGWQDPFSLDVATQRQAEYGRRFGDGSYTPEMVVDGTTAFVGSDRSAGEVAIHKAQDVDPTAASLSAVRKGNAITVSVGAGSGSAQVILVGYDAQHVTSVGRGENGGRTLKESNIVRSFQPIGQWMGKPAVFGPQVPAGEKSAVLLEAPDGRIVGAARVTDEP